MTDPTLENARPERLSLDTAAARNLATTTKTPPQMRGITSRWLLRVLPWVQVDGGVYRVNRRFTCTVGDGRVSFVSTGTRVRVVPPELAELPALRGFADTAVLEALADRFEQREYRPGDVIAAAGDPVDHVFLMAHGKAGVHRAGEYGDDNVVGVLVDGDHFGDAAMEARPGAWQDTVKARTACTVLVLPRNRFQQAVDDSAALRSHLEDVRSRSRRPSNRYGEADIAVAAGHAGEPDLPGTFVDYEASPREYELSVAQTVLRVHTRVADLYNQPMNQVEEQLRLTVEALRERQEDELVNNRDFGLLHNADLSQRIPTRTGPPTPDDLDELVSRRRKTQVVLAHPRAIAAFGRECSRRGVYPDTLHYDGHAVTGWRGIPMLPCDKIPVTASGTSSILAMRTGEHDQGVVGLHHIGLPDEYQPGLSVRFMGISEKAIMSYLVSTYYSAAVLVPDALGILENVEIGR
ncbi:cyclic nucleotide-binding domain-containing protein [Streptomonospora sp. PA3]|uniref:family 2B encapsulin nanocompartment shell protein n=1 Tax=Streptomonospora sp. PA3 TaxID=2607326 RepID=UPI0012DF931B|nr:family 2B encapsulin nanocompartment shell protein [Streptomonospora sp. PA3]MUL43579.1 cyclic nucleotide-binding domain-containing protein [Streptomonospora sp. PA3]